MRQTLVIELPQAAVDYAAYHRVGA